MLSKREKATRRQLLQLTVAALFMMPGWSLLGCASADTGVIPTQLESRVTSDGTADDHMAAATLYLREAQRLQAEAARYEQEAAAITHPEDSKGFRRNELLEAAQSSRSKAAKMQQLYTAHYQKALTMTGKQSPQ